MTDAGTRTPTRRPTRVPALQRILAVATAALLAVDAVVHLRDAHFYDAVTSSTVSQGTLFRAEAIAAIVVAVALLIRPHPLVWAVAVLVAASAAGAVLLYTYVDVGALGPLPNMYEPTWAVSGKRFSAVAETAATLLALIGLALALVHRRSRHRTPA
jgi:MYXO-CTERM domain-containing protein